MAIFPRNDKKLELPISRDSRYHPKVKYGLPLRIGHKLKSMLVTIIMIACTIYLLRYFLDGGEATKKSEDIPTEIEPPALPQLEEPEYYNYEFRPVDMKKVGKFDEGFQHYIINNEGTVIPNAEELYKEDLEMLLATSVEQYDLSKYTGSRDGALNREHVLICVPLRDAEQVLPLMFKHIMNLTYPHELIDLAFLVSDCSIGDNTFQTLREYSTALQRGTLAQHFEEQEKLSEQSKLKNEVGGDLYLKYMDKDYLDRVKDAFAPPFHASYAKPFRSVQIFKKDFGQVIGQGFSDRHHVKVQGSRRKLMGKARNWLTANALKPYHTWVYWRDADVELCPGTVIEDLMSTGYDVIVPNVWRPLPTFLGGKQGYDLNSWIESREALALAETLDEDDVIVEGYAEYATWRYHLASEREDNGELTVLDLDGVGGVSILAKAKLFRSGVHFPAFAFENHAETEAFGKMAKKMGYKVGGLPHYTLWHIYEPSDEDLREVAIMEREGKRS